MRQYVFLLLSVIFSISASAQISLDEYRSEVLSRSLDVHGAVIESDRAYAESRVERTEILPRHSSVKIKLICGDLALSRVLNKPYMQEVGYVPPIDSLCYAILWLNKIWNR